MATPIPANVAPFTLAEIVSATGGASRSGDPDLSVLGVTTDSRADAKGKLFVALVGETFDGHRFLGAAVEGGAVALLVKRGASAPDGVAVIEVDDTLTALGGLARLHRRRWGGTVVGVGGSAGKTTTRSAIAAALEAALPGAVHSVPGNLNNRIGVPMVLLGLGATHGVAVVEIGTNVRGEVKELTSIAAPNIGVLTLVDVEHAEGLGSLEEIELEEGELLRGLPRNGTAIANGDDERVVRRLVASSARKKISYGTRGAVDYRIERRESVGLSGSRIAIERPRGRGRETLELEVPLLGLPGALAVTAAVAVADRVAGRVVPAERLASAFRSGALGEPGRLRAVELTDRTVVIDDSYNANPASVRAAVATAREIADDRGARLVLVLGEMRELGAASPELHEAVGRDVASSGAASLVAVGGDAARFVPPAVQGGIEATFASDAERAVADTLSRVRPGDVVLVKASRGVRAERVVEALILAKGIVCVIYELLFPLSGKFGWAGVLNVLRYVPFRAIMATLTAMFLCFWLAPWFIRELQKKQIGQVVRKEGPESHYKKAGTPTMGGALILLCVLLPTVLWADVHNAFVVATAGLTAGYGVVGYVDDRMKLTRRSSGGLPGRYKMLGLTVIGIVAISYCFLYEPALPHGWIDIRARLSIPFVAFHKHPVTLPLGVYVAFAVFVVVATSNAVNLTDGLDGLAIGPVMINAGTYLVWAYIAGLVLFGRPIAQYLDIPGIPEMGELAVFAASVIGAGIGFLWYNTYPAQVFMGDVGSLSLGGGLGMLAVLTKNELLSILLGGIFFVEAVSVITQVVSFKLFGRRVFLMAPIDHHFEKKGWPEPRIIVRFWIISILLSLVALASLKLR